jgi:hypothetical protein
MKVLRKVCHHCGYIMLFSVEVLCKAPEDGAERSIHPKCLACGRPQSIVYTATEIDMEEITPDPDIEALTRAVTGRRGVHVGR